MSFSNFFSNTFRKDQYCTTRKNELFNTLSLEPDQKSIIFERISEAKSPIVLERKLKLFFEQYPNTRGVAIIGNSIVQANKTVHILEDKIKQLSHRPTIELIDLMELSTKDHYYSVAYNSNYIKILIQNREKDLIRHLSKQNIPKDLIHLNITPVIGVDHCKYLFDHIRKQDIQLVIMNEQSFKNMKHFLVNDSKSLDNQRKINKAVFVV
ncbi:MAG: hypothetical protein ACI86M_003112 [Saprospiraceae bacterium]|jgi:hypothetical protein